MSGLECPPSPPLGLFMRTSRTAMPGISRHTTGEMSGFMIEESGISVHAPSHTSQGAFLRWGMSVACCWCCWCC